MNQMLIGWKSHSKDVKVKQINARKTKKTDNIDDVRRYHSENAATDEEE